MRAPTDDEMASALVFPKARRWPAALVGVAIGVGATLVASTLIGGDADPTSDTDRVDVELATAPIEIRDLIEEVEWTGELGYGSSVDLTAPVDGTVTATVTVGTVVRRGDVIVEIDEQPIVALYGPIPMWRDLDTDVDGDDVRQLETNLVALGYDPDHTVTVDETFTTATQAMVERWQEDLGVEATGTVGQDDVLIVAGPVSVTSAPMVGDLVRQGEVLGGVSARSIVTDVVTAAADAEEWGDVASDEIATLSVIVPVALDSVDEWFVGQPVTVTLPDDDTVDGEVVDIGTVAQDTGPGQTPFVEVEIGIVGPVADDLPASEVTVTVAGDAVLGAMVAPTRALLSLAEGGFAVEKVLDDGTTMLIAVETGTFDDGVVEIESDQLTAGDEVVVPR